MKELQKVWWPAIKRKANMIAMTLFVGSYFSLVPSPAAIAPLVLFLILYIAVYYYNDIADLDYDRTRDYLPSGKLIVRGEVDIQRYSLSLAWLSLLPSSLIAYFYPLLTLPAIGAIVLNFVRSHVRKAIVREILLAGVELLCFVSFWIALYNRPIPGSALPLFGMYSVAYAVGHSLYKFPVSTSKSFLRSKMFLFTFSTLLVFSVLSLPLASSSVFHFIAMLAASIAYISLVSYGAKKAYPSDMDRVFKYHELGLYSATAVFILAFSVWMLFPVKQNIPIPIPPVLREILRIFDSLQIAVTSWFLSIRA